MAGECGGGPSAGDVSAVGRRPVVLLATIAATSALRLRRSPATRVRFSSLCWRSRGSFESFRPSCPGGETHPQLLVRSLIAIGPWRALAAFADIGAGVTVGCLIDAGVGNHVEWLQSFPGDRSMPETLGATGRFRLVVALLRAVFAGAAEARVAIAPSAARAVAARTYLTASTTLIVSRVPLDPAHSGMREAE